MESPRAPAVSVGECARGTTPPPHPQPQGSGPQRRTLAARGGEEGERGKELVGAPGRRTGVGPPWQPNAGGGGGGEAPDRASLYRLRSTTPGPLHPPQSGERCGGLSHPSGGFAYQAPGKSKAACGHFCSILVATLAPGILPGTHFLLSPAFSPHSSSVTSFAWRRWSLSPPPHFRMSWRHLFGSVSVPGSMQAPRGPHSRGVVHGASPGLLDRGPRG